jgi:hypothetical protein
MIGSESLCELLLLLLLLEPEDEEEEEASDGVPLLGCGCMVLGGWSSEDPWSSC